MVDDHRGDERYFEGRPARREVSFDASLLREPLTALPHHRPVVLSLDATVTDAMRAMQRERHGYVIVTDDGTPQSKLAGIFTERDVLYKIVDKGRNPATLPLSEVMTPDPEVLPHDAPVAYVLNKMSVGGFRHVPVVDEEHRPVSVISVRDVVEFLVQAFPREVLNLPAEFRGGPPKSREGA